MAMQSPRHIPLIMEIGKRILSARKELGLSQEELAQKTGLSRASISQIENGRRQQVKPDVIRKIAKELKKPEAYFYGVKIDEETALNFIRQSSLPSPLGSVLPKLLSLPCSQQEQLGHIIEQLLVWHESEATI